jgi:hypothetical protein
VHGCDTEWATDILTLVDGEVRWADKWEAEPAAKSFAACLIMVQTEEEEWRSVSPPAAEAAVERRGSVSSTGSVSSVDTESTAISSVEEADEPRKKFKVKSPSIFVTWSQSGITDVEEFHGKLKKLLPAGTLLYGCKELHEDGNPHYHAVIKFPVRPNWRDAIPRLRILRESGEVDTNAIRITPPRKWQREADFLEGTQDYMEKEEEWDRVMFGERITMLSAGLAKKRAFEEVANEPDMESAKRKLMAIDVGGFMKNYITYTAYLKGEKGRGPTGGWEDAEPLPCPWKVPREVEEWHTRNVLSEVAGRPEPLILIGGARLGKTEWAVRAGAKPIVMSGSWNAKNYRADATHVVLNDVDFRSFGSGKNLYWREFLGCQKWIDMHDRYMPTSCKKWGWPVIVTCNHDNDPRKIGFVEEYLRSAPCVVVELSEPLY